MKILAIDPGETTGYATFGLVCTDILMLSKLVLLRTWEEEVPSIEEYTQPFLRLLWREHPDFVVIEDYRVHHSAAGMHIGRRLFTPELIGAIEALCVAAMPPAPLPDVRRSDVGKAPVKCQPWALGFRWTPPDREWLYDQYITRGKSTKEIAREIGAGKTTVSRWFLELHVPRRTQSQCREGSKHPRWSGGSKRRSREQANRVLQDAGVPRKCAGCGALVGYILAHHIDGDPFNNTLENLQYLCKSCHKTVHYEMREFPQRTLASLATSIKVVRMQPSKKGLWPDARIEVKFPEASGVAGHALDAVKLGLAYLEGAELWTP